MTGPKERKQMKVGLAQVKPIKADLSTNIARIKMMIAESADDLDLMVFSETNLSGYFLEGGVSEVALTVDTLIASLGRPPENCPDIVLGFYEDHLDGPFNSVAYFEPGLEHFNLKHVHRKLFLPTYGVFDEARFVRPGKELSSFPTKHGMMGLLVCEDMWHSLPSTILALQGAELIIGVSASPARDFKKDGRGLPGNLKRWDALTPSIAIEHGVFVVVSQLVGSEAGKIFPGGSIVSSPDGSIIGRSPLMEEGVTSVTIDTEDIYRVRAKTPLLSDLQGTLPVLCKALMEVIEPDSQDESWMEDHHRSLPRSSATKRQHETSVIPGTEHIFDLDLELVEKVLVEFVRDEFNRNRGFDKAVIGLSGGVDSSVALYLAVSALGPENVIGIKMPYATSSTESIEHADLVLKATMAQEKLVDVSRPIDSYIQQYEEDLSPLRRGNLAARFRSLVLFDQSAKENALPLGTGNKSERLLGYYTWHADDSPPINPIGDLYKTQVWELARHLGVPSVIVDKPASADLVTGVNDEDELGISYEQADPILYWLLEGYSPEELKRNGFSDTNVDLVWKRLSQTHWKRELPTVAMMSSTAIGEFYLRPKDF
ncbi:MAG: NAD+ synthase [Gemmatimonadota bacterium]|nr:NAD+ synthase [Gemmatimonadota bacterium]